VYNSSRLLQPNCFLATRSSKLVTTKLVSGCVHMANGPRPPTSSVHVGTPRGSHVRSFTLSSLSRRLPASNPNSAWTGRTDSNRATTTRITASCRPRLALPLWPFRAFVVSIVLEGFGAHSHVLTTWRPVTAHSNGPYLLCRGHEITKGEARLSRRMEAFSMAQSGCRGRYLLEGRSQVR